MRTTPPASASKASHGPAGVPRAWNTWIWAAIGAVLLGVVFLLYAEPDFVVMMADQMWACF